MAKRKISFRHRIKNRRVLVAIVFDVFFIAVVAFVFNINFNIFAASHNITGGSYGPLCNSGGYFTPSTMTISSGDTITISVPANDPYSGGLEVHGFPEGDFTVQNGHSHTTSALTSNVSFYGSWPYTGCTKGSGTITVTHPAPPPPPPPPSPTPTPSPTPHPSPTPPTSAHPAPSPSPTSSGNHTPPPPTAKTSPNPSPTPSPSPMHAPNEHVENVQQPAQATATNSIQAEKTSSHLTPQRKAVGFTSLFLAALISGWIIWQLFLRKPMY